jgi:YD repeat-containing protein
VQDIRFDYDKAGRLIKIDYGKGQTIDYTYDDYGRVLTALTGQGVKTTYTWDALDRKTSERNDIPGMGHTLLEWTYTPSGRKRSVAVWRGDTSVDSTSPSSPISNIESPINPSPRLLQKTTYTYDDLGRYTTIAVNDEPRIHYDYDPASLRLLRKRFWNGWWIAYEHFDDGRPKSIVATNDEGKTVTDCHYIWRKDGKLDQRTLNGIHHQYRYDSLGRLTEVVKTTQTNADISSSEN